MIWQSGICSRLRSFWWAYRGAEVRVEWSRLQRWLLGCLAIAAASALRTLSHQNGRPCLRKIKVEMAKIVCAEPSSPSLNCRALGHLHVRLGASEGGVFVALEPSVKSSEERAGAPSPTNSRSFSMSSWVARRSSTKLRWPAAGFVDSMLS